MPLTAIRGVTLAVPDMPRALAAFAQVLPPDPVAGRLADSRALGLGRSDLAGAASATLDDWLTLVESAQAPAGRQRRPAGWASLALPMADAAWRAVQSSDHWRAIDESRCLLDGVGHFVLLCSPDARREVGLVVPNAAAAAAYYAGLGVPAIRADGAGSRIGELAQGDRVRFIQDSGALPSDAPCLGIVLVSLARSQPGLAPVAPRLLAGATGERLELVQQLHGAHPASVLGESPGRPRRCACSRIEP